MRKKIAKILRSFKSKILLSFFAFIRIFLLWICIYFIINKKQNNLVHFTNHLAQLQNDYAQSTRHLQAFILTGYHKPSFYLSGKQSDIDTYETEQNSILKRLVDLEDEAKSNHIDINSQLKLLSRLHTDFLDSVTILKDVYFEKGFKDYGTEGTLRKYAHYLEDSCPIQKQEILMLRRREKDFMLRDEQIYIDEFNTIADEQIARFATQPATLAAIKNYKKYFNEYALLTERLSLNTDHGLYGHVQRLIDQLDSTYLVTNYKEVREVSGLNNLFKSVLLGSFILLIVAAIYLSIVLSNNLTKDIKKLNTKVGDFVRSGFKHDESQNTQPLTSKITEIQGLNDDFSYLRQALNQTLTDLENSIKEEREVSADHEMTIKNLCDQLTEMEEQMQQIKNASAMLDVFYQNSDHCQITIDKDLKVTYYNNAASAFVQEIFDKQITKGGLFLDTIDESLVYTFTNNIQQSFSGKQISEKLVISTNIHDTSIVFRFFPLPDKEGNILAVGLSALKLTKS